MTTPGKSHEQNLPKRVTHMMLMVIFGVAVVGFFMGIRTDPPEYDALNLEHAHTSRVTPSADAIPALGYDEVRGSNIGPNRDWRSDLGKLPRADDDLLAEIIPALGERQASLARRTHQRAYDGAPPVIPHMVDPGSDANCISCHTESVRVGAATSAKLPHPYLTNCQQCHVPAEATPFQQQPLAENTFVGLRSALAGERASIGAPPVIPHPTFMRQNCLACHGPSGDPGLRTSHPSRSNCLQCHAHTAPLDHSSLAIFLDFPAPKSEQP